MQDLVAILIVLAAAAFLLRRGWQQVVHRRGGSCGGCASCPSSHAGKSPPLVTIDVRRGAR